MTEPTFSEANRAIDTVRKYLLSRPAEERLLLIAEIAEGVCVYCGYDIPEGETCHCTNNE